MLPVSSQRGRSNLVTALFTSTSRWPPRAGPVRRTPRPAGRGGGSPGPPARLRSVSTLDQNPDLQLDALRSAGCYRLFVDHASGAIDERVQLTGVLDQLRPGDTLVVWKLDRLGRSLRHLIDTVGDLQRRGIGFRSLPESIDTTTSTGKLIFHIF